MATSRDDLTTQVLQTHQRLETLQGKETAHASLSEQYAQQLSELMKKGREQEPATPKRTAPSLETHTSEDITRWYRKQIAEIIQAGKQPTQTAEAVQENTHTPSP